MTNKTIILAGGTGLIGTRLQALLREEGYAVRLLTRTPKGEGQFAWNPEAETIDERALVGADAIINLAGAGIADGRWTEARKKSIVDSRVKGAQTLRRALARMDKHPQVYISASAVGYYGDSGEQLMHETDPPGPTGFKAHTCVVWEDAALEVASLGIPTVVMRIGLVLAKEGGALREIVRPLRFGLGAYFANGQAWYPWIHRDDMCRVFIWALRQTWAATDEHQPLHIYNAAAPNPVRNLPLVKAAAKAMRQPALFVPAPAFVLRLMLGEMSDVILDSNKVSSEKLERAGFSFQFTDVDSALKDILG